MPRSTVTCIGVTKRLLALAALLSAPSLLLGASDPAGLQTADRELMTAVPFDASQPLRRKVADGDSLRFFFGAEPAREDDKRPVHFRVTAESGGAPDTLFERTVDPSAEPKRGWQEARVDLSSLAGRAVTFRFACSATNGRWAGVRVGRFTRRPGQFNVVLISLDTLRSDHLGLHGYARDTSPHIDAIGRAGVDFLHGVAASCWTTPSHMSVFTSLLPASHGLVFRDKQAGVMSLSRNLTTLAAVLQSDGYITSAFTGGLLVSHIYGFDRGFDLYQEHYGTDPMNAPSRDAIVTFRDATAWVADHRNDRFFLFLHTYDIHEPYRHTSFVKPGMDERTATVAAYDSGIRFVDDFVGKFVDHLRKLGLAESTLVVIVSDHGDELWDHGYASTHGHSLYEELVNVPVIFHSPARIHPRVVRDAVIDHIDIAPTILDFLHVAAPPQFQGRSFLPVLEGGKAPDLSVGYSEMEHFNDSPMRVPFRQMKAVHMIGPDGEFKLIISPSIAFGNDRLQHLTTPDKELSEFRNRVWMHLLRQKGRELYDLSADPHERQNLADHHPDLLKRMEKLLDGMDAMESAVRAAPMSDRALLSPEREEQLRSLAY